MSRSIVLGEFLDLERTLPIFFSILARRFRRLSGVSDVSTTATALRNHA